MEWEGIEKIIFYPKQEKVEMHLPSLIPPEVVIVKKAKRVAINRLDVFHELIEDDRVQVDFRFAVSCELKDDSLICKSPIKETELLADIKEDLEKLRREYGITREQWKDVLSSISWIY